MPEENISLEYQDNIAVVCINRPQKRNAFNAGMFSELETVTEKLKSNLPRVIVLTGSGDNAFCAGFDVHPDNPMNTDLVKSVETGDEGPARLVVERIRAVIDAFVQLPVPIIAAINGLAYGGGAETTMRCDLRVIDPAAVICFSEVRLGLMPDWGGSPHLVRLAGPAIAADLILTARTVTAEEALTLKLVNRISAPGNALNEAIELGRTIAANGPRAVRSALEVTRRSPDLPLAESLDLETDRAITLIASGEFIHGVAAFLERRPPEFPDK